MVDARRDDLVRSDNHRRREAAVEFLNRELFSERKVFS